MMDGLEFVAAALGFISFHIADYFAVQLRALYSEYYAFSREHPTVFGLCWVNSSLQWAEPVRKKSTDI